MLEVGCGAAGVLSFFKDRGSDVFGLDFDDVYLDEARLNSIPVMKGSIENLKGTEKFDLIILSHLLEYIVDPVHLLQKLQRFLTKNGVIYIEVPSLDNVREGGYKYDLLNYWQNVHTIHFTKESLNLLCKRVGLTSLKTTSFIHSCWKLSNGECDLLEFEKQKSLMHTKNLLQDIEAYRQGRGVRILKFKLFLRSSIKNIL